MSRAVAADRTRSKAARPGDGGRDATASRLADLALIAAFLALTFLLGAFPLKDTDFWWHLKAGDGIRQTGQIPTVDIYSFGAEGRSWVDLHWGFQVLLSWGFAHGGVIALNLAKCAITTLAVGLLVCSRRPGWPAWAMVLGWLPALLVLNGRMYIRPETISLLYLAIVLAILFRWGRHPWLAFGLPAVQVCWVNTHGLFLLEPILIGFALAGALVRRGALAAERRGWWRVVALASMLTGLACLANPYGLAGALYPLQLAATMRNPIFSGTIAELKPLLTFMGEVGLDSLPLNLHLFAFGLGVLSFALPMAWAGWVAIADRGSTTSPTKGKKKEGPAGTWRPSLFRALLFAAFSALSLAATRNSHQFAAVVGTVTAWNFAEWAGAIRARRGRLDPSPRPPGGWPRLVAFAAVGLTFAAVASGRFYVWSGEGRTVGLGEEPLWFPHDAVKFAGGPGMPDRLVGFHNGHPALYEYYWSPGKKPYQDARLEVVGPDLYKDYLELGRKIGGDLPGWSEELERMGRPAVLIDNLHQDYAPYAATLMKSRRWRCVWFDPIACLFVHDSYAKAVEGHAVDFLARHFGLQGGTPGVDPASLAASCQALRFIASIARGMPGGEARAQAMFLVGLDDARRLRDLDPGHPDGWKQAGLIEYFRGLILTEETLPRFRLPFDPVFDLSPARSTYLLRRALEIDPDDGIVQRRLAQSFDQRGMSEPALPLLARFVGQPNRNRSQREEKAKAAERLATLQAGLGVAPSTKWANLSELDRLVGTLSASGRVSTLAEVMESAYRPQNRPRDWADRLAILHLHLGEPAKARATWLASPDALPAAPRLARVAATYLVEGDFEAARKAYREAIAADPASFEAHYGLAVVELDAGRALEAAEQGRLAIQLSATDHARAAARAIVVAASPYAAGPSSGLPKEEIR